MNLVLDKKYEDEFYTWLVLEIKKLFPLFIKRYKLISLSNYLNIDCYQVLIKACDNLIVKDFKDNKIITINDDAMFGKYNLKQLCKFINNGNMEIKGYDIFTQVFFLIKRNIKVYHLLYKGSLF